MSQTRLLVRPDRVLVASCERAGVAPSHGETLPSLEAVMLPAATSVTLLVPGDEVRIHELPLPARNRRRFLAAVPFALEETLFGDPEQYHFVPLPVPNGGTTLAVAVIERERLATWRDRIEQRGWRLRALLPDYLCLPPPANGSWLLDLRAAPPLLRRPDGGAALPGCDVAGAEPPAALLLALDAAAVRPNRLELLVADELTAARVEGWREPLAATDIALAIRRDATPRDTALVCAATLDERCTLLTGSFAPPSDAAAPWRRLLPTAALAGLVLLAFAGLWLTEGIRLAHQHEALTAAVTAQYRALVPDARNVIDPRFQLEAELERLRAARSPAAQSRDLLGAFDGLATALGGEARVRALGYDAAGLRLDLDVPDFAALDATEQRLGALGSVTRDDARQDGARVRAVLRLAEAVR